MSQTAQSKPAQSKPAQSKPGQGGRGRGPPIYGRGPPGADARPRRPRREPEVEVWVPKTILGKKLILEKLLLLKKS